MEHNQVKSQERALHFESITRDLEQGALEERRGLPLIKKEWKGRKRNGCSA